MLTVICGEDNVESRNYYLALKNDCQRKGNEVYDTNTLEIDNVPSLFARKRIYFSENINKKINKKNLRQMGQIKKIITSREIELVDWEDQTPARELKIVGATVKEFKPSQSIFKLTEACYPGNFGDFLTRLHELPEKMEDGFIFIMLVRHLRNLLLVKTGGTNAKLASWQIVRLRQQAGKWTLPQLLSFYDGLYRIDVSTKTSRNPFSFRKSLDILTSYYV